MNPVISAITFDKMSGRNLCGRVNALGEFRRRFSDSLLWILSEDLAGTRIEQTRTVVSTQILKADVEREDAYPEQVFNDILIDVSGLAMYSCNMINMIRTFRKQDGPQRFKIA